MIGPGGPKACGGRKRPAWPRDSASGTTPPSPRVRLLAQGPQATTTTSALARVPSLSHRLQPWPSGRRPVTRVPRRRVAPARSAARTNPSATKSGCACPPVGSYEPTGGHAQPLFVADGFVRAAERAGATLRLGTRVTGLRPDGQGWSLWLSDGTRASAEVVVVACGPWANNLTRGLGGVVPLALSRGQAGRFRPPHAFGPPGPIISDHAQELWIKPEGNDGHYLIGGRGGRLDRSPHQRQ